LGHTPQTNEDPDAEPETEKQLKDWQRVEETGDGDGATSSDTLEEAVDVVHVVGDIIQVRRPFSSSFMKVND
jgi:hypothetical protein